MTTSMLDVLELLGIDQPPRFPGHISCLMHEESTPSLWITDDHWWAFCCNVGGDAIDLVRHSTGATFSQAKRFIESGIGEEFERPERVERPVIDFGDIYESLDEHEHVGVEFVNDRWPHLDYFWLKARFGVVSTLHYLALPHWTRALVTGIKTRSVYTGDKKSFAGSTYGQLYRSTPNWQDPVGVLYLCEGESDTWSMQKVVPGKSAIAVVRGLPSGVAAWKAHLDELATFDTIHLYLDNDERSEEQVDPLTEALIKRNVRVINGDLPREHKDVTEAVMAGWSPK